MVIPKLKAIPVPKATVIKSPAAIKATLPRKSTLLKGPLTNPVTRLNRKRPNDIGIKF